MQIAVNERLCLGHELLFHLGDFDAQRLIRLQRQHLRLKFLVEAIPLGLAIRFGKDQVFRDLAQFGVDKLGDLLFFRAIIQHQIRCFAQRSRHEQADMLGKMRVLDALDQPLAHDNMVIQILHRKQIHVWIVEIDARGVGRNQIVLDLQRRRFDARPVDRQRPIAPDQTQVGQRLLNDDRPFRIGLSPDLEDEVQITVAYFSRRQGFARAEDFFEFGTRPDIIDDGRWSSGAGSSGKYRHS